MLGYSIPPLLLSLSLSLSSLSSSFLSFLFSPIPSLDSSPGWPQTRCVVKDDLEFLIFLLLHPEQKAWESHYFRGPRKKSLGDIQRLWQNLDFIHLKFCFLFFVCGCLAYIFVRVPCVCQVPTEVRRWSQTTWDWSYRWLWATIWVLGIEHGSSTRATSGLNY